MLSKETLSDPGYTPRQRDLGTVLDWLLDEDEATSKLSERALLNAGEAVASMAISRLDTANAEQRVRLVRLLGRVAQRTKNTEIGEILNQSLSDPEPRVVRSAIVALGKLPPAFARTIGAQDSLAEKLPHLADAERRAAIEAVGKIGGQSALAMLSADAPRGGVESQLFERAKMRLQRSSVVLDVADRVLLDAKLERPCTVAVLHRRGLSDIVARQLGELGPGVPDGPERRLLSGYAGSLLALFRARSMLVPAIVVELVRPRDDAEWANLIADAICQPHVLELLQRATSTRPRLRLTLPKEGHQRALLWATSELLARKTERVEVHPKAALWEVWIDRGRTPRIYLVPKRFEDPRFGYREREISGASHPTIAAALVDVLKVRESDIIWDPFVGSGLELIECAFQGEYRELIGTDNNPRSLEAASANVRAANLPRVRLLNADARTARLGGITGIVTNPPLGIRHQRDGRLEPLLLDFLTNARQNLEPLGRLVWLSPLPQKTAESADRLGFAVTRIGPVDVGGLTPELQVLRVPPRTLPGWRR